MTQYQNKRAPKTKQASKAKKMSEKTVKKIVNKELRKKTEVKKVDYTWGLQNINHNNYSAVPLQKFQEKLVSFGLNTPTRGTGDNNYTGTSYKIIGQHLYFTFSMAADRLNTKFRVLVIRRPAHLSVPSIYTDIFDNITGNIMTDPIDKDVNSVIYDKIIGVRNINPTNSTDNTVLFKKVWLSKQKYKVQVEDNDSSNVKYPRFFDYLCVFAFDAHGSLNTDTIGSVQVSRRLYFVDDI